MRSWRLSLEAANRAPKTITQYLESQRLFEQHLVTAGHSTAVVDVQRSDVERFLADILGRRHR